MDEKTYKEFMEMIRPAVREILIEMALDNSFISGDEKALVMFSDAIFLALGAKIIKKDDADFTFMEAAEQFALPLYKFLVDLPPELKESFKFKLGDTTTKPHEMVSSLVAVMMQGSLQVMTEDEVFGVVGAPEKSEMH